MYIYNPLILVLLVTFVPCLHLPAGTTVGPAATEHVFDAPLPAPTLCAVRTAALMTTAWLHVLLAALLAAACQASALLLQGIYHNNHISMMGSECSQLMFVVGLLVCIYKQPHAAS